MQSGAGSNKFADAMCAMHVYKTAAAISSVQNVSLSAAEQPSMTTLIRIHQDTALGHAAVRGYLGNRTDDCGT